MARSKKNLSTGPIEGIFLHFPSFPKDMKDFLVLISSWVVLIVGGIIFLFSLKTLGQFTLFKPYIEIGQNAQIEGIIYSSFGVISAILFLLAFLGMNNRRKSAWRMTFWGVSFGMVASILSSGFLGIIVPFIGLYFLFQIKSYYK